MNRIELTGKNAVVTGGARGIGYAITRRLLDSGASCCIWDINEETAAAAADRLGDTGACSFRTVDLTRADQVDAAAESTGADMGSIDILVNNAGVAGAAKRLWSTIRSIGIGSSRSTCSASTTAAGRWSP